MSLTANNVQENSLETAAVHHFPDSVINLPKSTNFRMQVVNITPEIAAAWLAMNRHNRRLRKKRIAQYAADMLAGKWMETGEPIKFVKGNRMADGQHRLYAIIQSGATIRCIVIVGLDDAVQVSMDTGMPRTAKDILGIEGLDEWDAKILGTALPVLIGVSNGLPVHNSLRVPNHAVRDFYLDNASRLESSLRFIKDLPRKYPPIPHSRAFLLNYLFSKNNPMAADEFFAGLYTGEILASTDPVYQLREKLKECQVARDFKSNYDQLFACIKAWNMTRSGKGLSQRNIFPRRDEVFPVIK